MTFAFPAAFWFALLALPVTAAFFYRRRTREKIIPALEVWESLGIPVSSKSISTLLRRLLSLLVQLLLLALLLFALAEPFPASRHPARAIIVLDVAATMQTREGADQRMAIARGYARHVLDELAIDGEAMVFRAAQTPVLAQAMTRKRAEAQKAVDATESLDVEGDLMRAIEAARAFVDPRVPGEVVVISDFTGVDVAALRHNWHEASPLQLIQVGQPRPDAAITGLWTEQRGAERLVVARIAQRGMAGTTVPVRLTVNHAVIGTQSVVLEDNPVRVQFLEAIPPGAEYEVTVDSGDSLSVDDRALGVVPQRESPGICLVTEGNPALERALLSNPLVRLRIVAPSAYQGPGTDLVVIVDAHSIPPCDPANASYLFIGASDPSGWCKAIGSANAGPITHWAGDHPALADIDPTVFHVQKAMKVQWSPGLSPVDLVNTDDVSLMTQITRAGPGGLTVHHLYWLFDLASSDLSRRLSFPLLLWNAVDYLAARGRDVPTDFQLTGRPLHIPGNADAPPAVVDPRGQTLSANPGIDDWVISDTLHQGIYKAADTHESFAFNLLSDRTILPLPSPELMGDHGRLASGAGSPSLRALFRQRLSWHSLVAAAAGLALVEWFLFSRRLIRIG